MLLKVQCIHYVCMYMYPDNKTGCSPLDTLKQWVNYSRQGLPGHSATQCIYWDTFNT